MITIRQNIITGMSWSSAAAGAVVGLILFTALSALGMSVAGAALTYDSLSEVGWGSLAWMVVCLAVSGYVTGLIAASGASGLATKPAATLSGVTAGCILALILTMVSYNLISSTVQVTASLASGTASAVGSAASVVGSAAQVGASQLGQMDFNNIEIEGTLRELGLSEEYNSITAGGFDRNNLEQAIAEASPELSQGQVTASVNVVISVMERAQQNITRNIRSIQDVRQLPQTIRSEWQQVTNQLTGQSFVSRLETQGLSRTQAEEVRTVVTQRIDQMQSEANQAIASVQNGLSQLQTRVEDTASQAVEVAGDVASTSALSWLVVATILVGLAGLGGYQFNGERRILDQARAQTPPSTRTNSEPSWSDERPRRAGNE